MKKLILITLATSHLFPSESQSDSNHFGTGVDIELYLNNSEIATMKEERQQKAFRRKVKTEENIGNFYTNRCDTKSTYMP